MDAIVYIRFVLTLILVLGLILGLAWGMRRLGFGVGAQGPLTRRRRLRVVESAMVDGRHRAVLIRRDETEHLVLVGPNTSQVIERGIPAPAEDASAPPPQSLGTTFRQMLSKTEPQP